MGSRANIHVISVMSPALFFESGFKTFSMSSVDFGSHGLLLSSGMKLLEYIDENLIVGSLSQGLGPFH